MNVRTLCQASLFGLATLLCTTANAQALAACTLAACTDDVRVGLKGFRVTTGRYPVTVTADEVTYACTLVVAPGLFHQLCTSAQAPGWMDVEASGDGEVTLSIRGQKPMGIDVMIVGPSGRALRGFAALDYKITFPNGEECDSKCQTAQVDLVLDAMK